MCRLYEKCLEIGDTNSEIAPRNAMTQKKMDFEQGLARGAYLGMSLGIETSLTPGRQHRCDISDELEDRPSMTTTIVGTWP